MSEHDRQDAFFDILKHLNATFELLYSIQEFKKSTPRQNQNAKNLLAHYNNWLEGRYGAEIVTLDELKALVDQVVSKASRPNSQKTLSYGVHANLEEFEAMISEAINLQNGSE